MLNKQRIEKIRKMVRGLDTVEQVKQNISFWVELYIKDYNKYSKMIKDLKGKKFLVDVSYPLLPIISSQKMILKEVKQVEYKGFYKSNEVPKAKELIFQYINCIIDADEYYIVVSNDGLFEYFQVSEFSKFKKRIRNLQTYAKRKFLKGHDILMICFNERAEGISKFEAGDFNLSESEEIYNKIQSFFDKKNKQGLSTQ